MKTLKRSRAADTVVLNPITRTPLGQEAAEYVLKLRTVRRNARKASRSGNPAVREPAKSVLRHVGPMIAAVYVREARR